MQQEIKWNLKLVLQGPFITQSTRPEGFAIDAALARRSNGRYYIPGTQMKGKARQACAELNEAAPGGLPLDIPSSFGPSPAEENSPTSSISRERGRLLFTDCLLDGNGTDDLRYRIQIDSDTGSVGGGMLQVIESRFAPGDPVTFLGSVFYQPNADEDPELVRRALEAAFLWTTAFGAEKTIGFGRLITVSLKVEANWQRGYTPRVQAGIAPDSSRFRMILEFEEPVCIAKRHIGDNLFESDSVIPGGVVKGALATVWQRSHGQSAHIAVTGSSHWPALGRHFSAIRFTHALPASSTSPHLPQSVPFSLGFIKESGNQVALHDFALERDPCLLKKQVPRFAPDWKYSDLSAARHQYGWPKIDTETRVRSAQSREHRRAKDEALFAYEMLVPDGLRWVSTVDLSAIAASEDRNRIQQELREICQNGLPGIGKTKARAQVSFAPVTAFSESQLPLMPVSGSWIVTLQSDALLCDPRRLDSRDPADSLHREYSRVWSELLGSSWQLSHYFAQQDLAGGRYLFQRFQQRQPYRPFMLTLAGSVFVFPARDPAREATCLSVLINSGLPIDSAISDFYRGDTWDTNPYIRQNGYGTIAVAGDLFQAPAQGDLHVIA